MGVFQNNGSLRCHSRESGNPCAQKVDSRLGGNDITDNGADWYAAPTKLKYTLC
jgi:hypothetical protein